MPRRDDIESILLIGSGPIVIGQACEFDYSGTQACRVLREEGYRVILANSNPATIMTDPDFADATYIEPLDARDPHPDHRAGAARRPAAHPRRPDGAEPGHGAGRGRRARRARRRAHRGQRRGHRHRRGPRAVQAGDDRDRPRRCPTSGIAHTLDEALAVVERDRPARSSSAPPTSSAAGAPASPRRPRSSPSGQARPRRQPHLRDPHRAVDRRVEGVRARGHARPGRQLRGHLLDRERRPHGRAHRRLDHGGAGPDPVRRRVPAHARRRLRLHPPGRGGDRRLQRAVRPRPDERRHGRHRDEPAGQPLVGAGLQGHRLPDRQDRRPPGRRLHARRDPQRHHREDPGQLRADHRLRRHQGAPLGLREVPGHSPPSSAPRCSRWARPWPSAGRSPSRCRRACARSSTGRYGLNCDPGEAALRRPRATTSWSARAVDRHARPALPARGRAAPGHLHRRRLRRRRRSTPGSSTRS